MLNVSANSLRTLSCIQNKCQLPIVSSPEPLDSQGEPIVYPCFMLVVVVYNVQTSHLKPLSQSLGRGNKVCIHVPGHMAKMTAMPTYGKHLRNLLWDRWTDFSETWYVASRTLAYHILYKS